MGSRRDQGIGTLTQHFLAWVTLSRPARFSLFGGSNIGFPVVSNRTHEINMPTHNLDLILPYYLPRGVYGGI